MSEYTLYEVLITSSLYAFLYIAGIRGKLKGRTKSILDGYLLISIIPLFIFRNPVIYNTMIIMYIFILTYVGIIHPKIDKTMTAVVGSILATLVLISLKVEDTTHGEGLISEESLLHFDDLQVIGLIIGTLLIVDVVQDSGFFHFLSIKILKASEGDPKKLLRYFGVLTLVLSALVNNISAMMIVGSLTLIACERLELNPKPFIITELSMTTVGGIITLISSVPNIIIATKFGITFAEFFAIGIGLAIVGTIANFAIFEHLFRSEFKMKKDPKELKRRVEEFNEWAAVKDMKYFRVSIIVMSMTILGFAFQDQLGISLSVIAIAGAFILILLTGKKIDDVMSKLDWELIAFFLGLFVLIASLGAVNILSSIALWLTSVLPESSLVASIILLWFISIFSGIVDNIVVAAAFGPVLFEIVSTTNYSATLFAWATIFGANFGGGLTPIGAPSAVVGLALLYRKTGYKMGWGEFLKTQGLATLVRLLLTTGYLAILAVLGI